MTHDSGVLQLVNTNELLTKINMIPYKLPSATQLQSVLPGRKVEKACLIYCIVYRLTDCTVYCILDVDFITAADLCLSVSLSVFVYRRLRSLFTDTRRN
jgi:hypothetical protein